MSDSYETSADHRSISPQRAAALARVLVELDAWCAPQPVGDLTANNLRAFIDAKLAAGFHSSALRRQVTMLRAHYRRLCDAGDLA
jgi:hypothetical protein